jgi:3-hydroxyisobutyrate dehydrogenase
MKITLLGIGTMGLGMGRCLLNSGFELTVYNRTASRAEPLSDAGATLAASPADAARDADIILSMLADDDASRSIWLGSEGALQAAPKGSILIESSTVTPAWIAELAEYAKAHGSVLLDAPVTGSRLQAAAGELTFLVGGSADTLEAARPALQAMSRKIVHAGPSGSGARLKLINNFLCGVQLASLAEAIGWMERSGLDTEVSLEALGSGAPGSPLIQGMSQRMMSRDYQVNFFLHLLEKDLKYAKRDAALAGIQIETATAPIQLFGRARELGLGEKDMSSVVEQFRSAAAAERSPQG